MQLFFFFLPFSALLSCFFFFFCPCYIRLSLLQCFLLLLRSLFKCCSLGFLHPISFYIPDVFSFFFFLLLLLAGMCVLCIHAPYVPYTYTKGKARRFSGNDADCCCSTLLLLLLFLTRLPCTFEVLKLTAFFFFSRLCLQARMFFYTTLPNNVFFFFSFFYTLNYSEQRDILTLQVFLCVFFFFLFPLSLYIIVLFHIVSKASCYFCFQ